VGTGSVTIKTATATTEYAVSATSDIDKNGEATLGDLVVGDAVTFRTTTANNTVTVDKLHTGNEALNKPSGPPPARGESGAGAEAVMNRPRFLAALLLAAPGGASDEVSPSGGCWSGACAELFKGDQAVAVRARAAGAEAGGEGVAVRAALL